MFRQHDPGFRIDQARAVSFVGAASRRVHVRSFCQSGRPVDHSILPPDFEGIASG